MKDDFNLDNLNFDMDDMELDMDFLDSQLKELNIEDIKLEDLDLGEEGLDFDKRLNQKRKVMVVDDDAGTLRNIKSMLDDMYDVCIANSGKKALNTISIETPEVILLDYEMPLMNGPETMMAIRQRPEYRDIPIVFLTGVNDRAQITAALALRPDGYLLKPVNREKLFSTIMEILNKKDGILF